MASGGTMIRTQSFTPAASAPKYLKAALKDIGVQEWVLDGKKKVSNPVVQEYVAKSLRYPVDKKWKGSTLTTAWCAYYMNAKLEDQNIPGTASGMARSFMKWGKTVDPGDIRQGDIVVMWRGQHNDGVTGHVYMFLWEDKTYYYGIGGNQGDKVSIQRFPKSKVLKNGIRRHRGLSESKTVKAGGTTLGNETVVRPLVDTIPDSPANPQGNVDGVIDAMQSAQDPLQALAAIKPVLQIVVTLITIALAGYILWLRYKAYKDGN